MSSVFEASDAGLKLELFQFQDSQINSFNSSSQICQRQNQNLASFTSQEQFDALKSFLLNSRNTRFNQEDSVDFYLGVKRDEELASTETGSSYQKFVFVNADKNEFDALHDPNNWVVEANSGDNQNQIGALRVKNGGDEIGLVDISDEDDTVVGFVCSSDLLLDDGIEIANKIDLSPVVFLFSGIFLLITALMTAKFVDLFVTERRLQRDLSEELKRLSVVNLTSFQESTTVLPKLRPTPAAKPASTATNESLQISL